MRFRHWLHMPEVTDGVRVVSMVRNDANHVTWKSMDIIVRFRIMARLKTVTPVKRLGILLSTALSGENV